MSFYMFFDELISNPKYKHLSSDAKVLYTLMNNRAGLSEKNGDTWRKNGSVFIYYTQKQTMEHLGCSHDKALKVHKELEKAELIKRVPQGQGKPHMVIVNCPFQTTEAKNTAQRCLSSPDCDKSDTNYIDKNILENSYLESTLPPDRQMVEEKIKENISYEILRKEMDNDILDAIVNIILDTLCAPTDAITIAGQRRRFCDVSARFFALNDLHIRYVYTAVRDNPNPIRYPQGFLLKLLFEANWAMCI